MAFIEQYNGLKNPSGDITQLHRILNIRDIRDINSLKRGIENVNNDAFSAVTIVPDLGEPRLSGAVISGTPENPAIVNFLRGGVLEELKAAGGATKLEGTVTLTNVDVIIRRSQRDNNTLQVDGIPILTWGADATIFFDGGNWREPITESAKELLRQEAAGRSSKVIPSLDEVETALAKNENAL
ncbi:MAG: hypothetical protein L0177_19905 [Chloroflexi bacterium]|nr:hypothetical protein [Chloroflexota bacterium]